MSHHWYSIFSQKYGQLLFWIGAVVVNIITFLVIYYKISPGSEPLVLHYNVILGVDIFGPGIELYRISIIGFVLLAINAAVSKLVKSPGDFLSFIASFVSFSVAVVLLAAVLFVLRVN